MAVMFDSIESCRIEGLWLGVWIRNNRVDSVEKVFKIIKESKCIK